MKRGFVWRIHPAGAVIFGFALLFCPSTEVLAAAAALLLHEAAHLLAMRLCGVQNCVVELTPFGGMADALAFERLPCVRQMICAAAGVAASAAAFAISSPFEWKGGLVAAFSKMNGSLLAVNCLPVWPLDGARVLVALAGVLGKEHTVRKALAFLAWFLGICLAMLGLYGAWIGWVNPSLLLAGPYLCYAASQGMLSEKIRRLHRVWEERTLSGLKLVTAAACPKGMERAAAPALLGRLERSRYQLLVVVDPVSGQISRVMTEQEMLEDIVGSNP